MTLSAHEALWFLPFVLPICIYVAFTDMAYMRITNVAVLALVAVFLIVGLIALPFNIYLWRFAALVVVLAVGIALNALGVLGAGDAKFAAAAAPFVAGGDLQFLAFLFAATLMAALVTHRLAKHLGGARLAPHWQSWEQSKKFPLGLALGPTLAVYLVLGLKFGS